MLKTFDISLDLKDKTSRQSFAINQNDLNTIEINISLTKNKAPLDISGAIPRIVIKKPSRLTVLQDCEVIDAPTGKIKVILNTQGYTESGLHQAEVYLYESEKISVTESFSYISNKAILNDQTVESNNNWQSINDAFIKIDENFTQMNENVQRIENADVYSKSETDGKISTVNAQLADKANVDIKGLSTNSTFDNSTIINTVLSSGVKGIVQLPKSATSNKYMIGSTIVIPNDVILDLNGNELNTLPSFITSNPVISFNNSNGKIRNGRIDANHLVSTGIRCSNSSTSEIQYMFIRGAITKGIDVQSSALSCNIRHVDISISGNYTTATGSVGLDMNAPDSFISHVLPVGYSIGIRNTGSNNHFLECHPWNTITPEFQHYALTAAFICSGQGSTYTQCYADSPRTADGLAASSTNDGFGFKVTNSNQTFIGCVSLVPYFSNSILPDNTSIGFYDTAGFNTYVGCFTWARSSSCRFLKDFDGSGVVNSTLIGNYTSNVTTVYGDSLKNALAQLAIYKKQASAFTSLPVTNDDQTGGAESRVQTTTGGGYLALRRYGTSHATTAYQKASVLQSIDANKFAIYSDFANLQFDIGSIDAKQMIITPDHITANVPFKVASYTTAARPTTNLLAGYMIFDTTLNKPVWRNSGNTAWVDATGVTV